MFKVHSVKKSQFRICDAVVGTDGTKIPCIVGQVGQVDEVSQNGYRYKKGFWDAILARPEVKDKIEHREMLGTIEHPISDEAYLKTPYDQASHVVVKAWTQDGNPYAVLGLLNNEKGNQIKALLEVGHNPGVSTRGLGSFADDAVSQYIVEDDYVLLGWDIVTSPNFADLKMEKVSDSLQTSSLFKELVGMNALRDSSYINYNRQSLLKDIKSLATELSNKLSLLSNDKSV